MRRFVATARFVTAGLAAVGLTAAAAALPQAPAGQAGKAAQPGDMDLKTFPLEGQNAQELQQVLPLIWEKISSAGNAQVGHGQPTHPGQPSAQLPAAHAGAVQASQQAHQPPRMVVNARTNTILVRGSKAELDAFEKSLKVLEGRGQETAFEHNGVAVYKLRRSKTDELVKTLNSLELNKGVITLPKLDAVVVTGDTTQAAQIHKVIEAVDKDARGGTQQVTSAQPPAGHPTAATQTTPAQPQQPKPAAQPAAAGAKPAPQQGQGTKPAATPQQPAGKSPTAPAAKPAAGAVTNQHPAAAGQPAGTPPAAKPATGSQPTPNKPGTGAATQPTTATQTAAGAKGPGGK